MILTTEMGRGGNGRNFRESGSYVVGLGETKTFSAFRRRPSKVVSREH